MVGIDDNQLDAADRGVELRLPPVGLVFLREGHILAGLHAPVGLRFHIPCLLFGFWPRALPRPPLPAFLSAPPFPARPLYPRTLNAVSPGPASARRAGPPPKHRRGAYP